MTSQIDIMKSHGIMLTFLAKLRIRPLLDRSREAFQNTLNPHVLTLTRYHSLQTIRLIESIDEKVSMLGHRLLHRLPLQLH